MKAIEFPSTGAGEAWHLTKDATARLPRGRLPILVRVARGTVLVTQEGEPEDHVLEAGDEAVFPPGGHVVAWALTDAAISTREAVGSASRLQRYALAS